MWRACTFRCQLYILHVNVIDSHNLNVSLYLEIIVVSCEDVYIRCIAYM